MATLSEGRRASRALNLLRRIPRRDRWALAALLVLPLAVFAAPAFSGHQVLLGDDITQNYPLRAFVGSQIRHGHLPLFDPYIWSGAPLLGGWNAGAAYPFTLLFAVLPASAAWTSNLLLTWWVAGIGCFAFLRMSRLAAIPSFLGALSFSFAGAMTAQVVHFGLVAGMSWVPVALLALLQLSRSITDPTARADARGMLRSRAGWTALLAVAGAMAILAGEPRAIADFGVIVAIYALWRGLRLGRSAGRYFMWVVLGLALCVLLGAVQWLPGVDAISTSQRAGSNAYLFTSGSLPNRWLLLMFVPDLLGGSGSLGQPSFLASYNLTEVTGYVGLMPLVASLALLGRLRIRRPLPEWLVWELTALVGVLLALGGSTPLWHLLIRVPLFGSQRLQSRNILVADMGFAFLLAYWSDAWLADRTRRTALTPLTGETKATGPGWSASPTTQPPPVAELPRARPFAELAPGSGGATRALGAIPALLVLSTVAIGMAWGAGFLRWLGVSAQAATEAGGLRWWFLPFGVLGLVATALILRGHRLGTRLRAGLLVGFVVIDLIAFTLMAVASWTPDPGGPSSRTTTASANAQHASPGASVATPPTRTSAAAYTGSGRFAVYDPNLLDPRGLDVIGAPDLNVTRAAASIQGYSSIVDGTYASATGSHEPTGLGQDVLDPRAIGNGTLDQLDTTVLFAPRDYFIVSPVSDPAPPDPVAGERQLAPYGRAIWYLGEDLAVSTIVVPDAKASQDLASGLRFGLITSTGDTSWAPRAALDGSHFLHVAFDHPEGAVAVVAEAGATRADLGSPSLTSADGTYYVADGQLQAAVVPPRWVFDTFDGSFAVFADRFARPALTLRGSKNASIRATAGPVFAPSAAAVSSTRGAEVIRAEAAIPGWTARWLPRTGSPSDLDVHRVGLVQGVEVPAGRGVLTWSYSPPGWTAGWGLSLGGLAALVALLLLPFVRTRRATVEAAEALEPARSARRRRHAPAEPAHE